MNNLDILYVYPASGRQKDFEPSIGIAYLQAYLKINGFTSKQYLPTNFNIDNIIDEILSYNAKIIGFSCYDMNYYYIKLLIIKLREKNPNIPIIIGGPTATFSTNIIFDDLKEKVDYIVRGYGEIATSELLNYLINKKGDLKDINNISYIKDNVVLNNELKTLPQNIDIFPSPYLSDIDFFPERKIVFTSRGCIHNCVYCNCPLICNKKIYYHSIKRVINELKYISNKSPDSYVLLGDDAFTLNIERAKEICKEIIKENIKLKLFCETRVDRIDDELLILLKKSGFIKIDFGLESASPKILRNVKKIFFPKNDTTFESEKIFLEKMKKIVSRANELNLDPMVNIITGLPGETKKEALETLDYVKKLKINSYSHNYLRFYSGTEIMKDFKSWGYVIKKDAFILPINIKYNYNVNEITPLINSISRSEIVRLKKQFIKIFLNKKYLDFTKDININDLSNINLNEEIFVYLDNEKKMDEISEIIVNNLIPTNNIIYILDNGNFIKVFNCFDRQNFILIHRIKDSNFTLPEKYYELLYIENLTDEIEKHFNKLNVNPFLNRFIILNSNLQLSSVEKLKQIINDYLETYEKESYNNYFNIINKFANYFNYDIDEINIDDIKKCLTLKIITISDLNIIKNFLSYYMLGAVNEKTNINI
ncbi:MAG: radical SAM protein [Bacilli bacterium]|nr:radical SAM protein [Bacilli bacterium]